MIRWPAIIALAVMAAPVGWLTYVAGQFLIANLWLFFDAALSEQGRSSVAVSVGGALVVLLLLPLAWGALLFAALRAWRLSRASIWICLALFAAGATLGFWQFGPLPR